MIRELIESGSPLQILATLIAFGLVVASILSLLFIIWGGINFILSAGNEDKIKKAMQTVRYSVYGLFVTFFAFFIVKIITKLLSIPFDLSFSTIIDLMSSLFQSFQ